MNKKEKENLLAGLIWVATFLLSDISGVRYFAMFAVGFSLAVITTDYLRRTEKG
jgi:hypothetical protein